MTSLDKENLNWLYTYILNVTIIESHHYPNHEPPYYLLEIGGVNKKGESILYIDFQIYNKNILNELKEVFENLTDSIVFDQYRN